MRKRIALTSISLAGLAMLMTACGGGQKDSSKLDPKNPVSVTIWNYYSGAQLDSFNALVEQFNEGRGKEIGVQVTSVNQGSLDDLELAVTDAVEKKAGADDVPNMFQAYTDFAYSMDKQGLVADISSYFTDEEKKEYIDGYIKEGEFSGDGSLKILPIAKSTEVLVLNQTDWDKFAQATGASTDDLSTLEGLAATAKKYYEWTDSLTPEPDDGKAFFGRDAMANYMLIGAKQLGVEIVGRDKDGKCVLNFDEGAMKRLWDNYYVPFVHGYFSAIGRFRSDDMKTGNVISYVGSSSSATFTPDTVTLEDNTTYPIDTDFYQAPVFEGGEEIAVQQGAGIVVTQGEEKEIAGSVEFLKWFTEPEQNIDYAVGAAYLPVKKEANDAEKIKAAGEGQTDVVLDCLSVAVDTVNTHQMYTTPPVENGSEIRSILETALSDKAYADRAQVEELIACGMSADEAAARYDTEENFKQWYSETKTKLTAQE